LRRIGGNKGESNRIKREAAHAHLPGNSRLVRIHDGMV
jgi:hypothetical protein